MLMYGINQHFPSTDFGLISFRIEWLDLAVQGTLKSLLQHHSSKASVLWHSAFFMVQLSHPSMTTGKTKLAPIQTTIPKSHGKHKPKNYSRNTQVKATQTHH